MTSCKGFKHIVTQEHKGVTEGGGGQKMFKFVWHYLWMVSNMFLSIFLFVGIFFLNCCLSFLSLFVCLFVCYLALVISVLVCLCLYVYVTLARVMNVLVCLCLYVYVVLQRATGNRNRMIKDWIKVAQIGDDFLLLLLLKL